MQCENQVKRTSVAMGQAHPVWKEEVTFKSVQITSDLQVSSNPQWTSCQSALHATGADLCPQHPVHFVDPPGVKACAQRRFCQDCERKTAGLRVGDKLWLYMNTQSEFWETQ